MSHADDWKHDRIASAERGENPTVVARMPSGFAVIADQQVLPGYCILLAHPRVEHLSDMDIVARNRFLQDMSLLGEAIERACRPHGLLRVNYAIYGNTDPFVHAHVMPRYDWEPDEYRTGPVWLYPRERWTEQPYSDEQHGELRAGIAAALREVMAREGVAPQ